LRHRNKERGEKAKGERVHSQSSSSDGNIVNVEKAETKKDPAIEARAPMSEGTEEHAPEPPAITNIATAGNSSSDPASIPKYDILPKNTDAT